MFAEARPWVESRLKSRGTRRPPGPRGLDNVDAFQAFNADPLTTIRAWQKEYGDTIYQRVGPIQLYTICHPHDIEQVLVKQAKGFKKDWITRDLEFLMGNGLVTSEGEYWRKQRKLAAPFLARKHIARYGDDMVSATKRWLASDRSHGEVEIQEEMLLITLDIVLATLFEAELNDDAHKIHEALDTCLAFFQMHAQSAWRMMPRWMPRPMMKEFMAAQKVIDSSIYDFIRQKRENGLGQDLLSRLIGARYDDGSQMSDTQLRDEAVTIFLAGHETTALTLTYVLRLLSLHPDVLEQVRAELAHCIGDRDPTVEDLPCLTYMEAVLKESMRLFPPVWALGREAIEDTTVGGYHVNRGAQFLIPQWVVHFDERWYPNPERFDPERWTDGKEKTRPRFSYFPFGGGPRVGIGVRFAMMEAMLVLATLLLILPRGQ